MRTTGLVFSGPRWDLDGPDGREVFDLPPAHFRVSFAEAMAFALRDGKGIGALPLWTALPSLRKGDLTRVLPVHRLGELRIQAFYTSREYLDAKIRSWIDFLQESIPRMLDDDQRTLHVPECANFR